MLSLLPILLFPFSLLLLLNPANAIRIGPKMSFKSGFCPSAFLHPTKSG
jgi:hypothetical protein